MTAADVAPYLVPLPALALIGWGLWLWAVRAGRSRRTLGLTLRLVPADRHTRLKMRRDINRQDARARWPWTTTDDDWRMEP